MILQPVKVYPSSVVQEFVHFAQPGGYAGCLQLYQLRKGNSSMLKSLEDMSSGSSDAANTANSLLVSFERGSTYFTLAIATKPIAAMKSLNVSLLSRTASIDGK